MLNPIAVLRPLTSEEIEIIRQSKDHQEREYHVYAIEAYEQLQNHPGVREMRMSEEQSNTIDNDIKQAIQRLGTTEAVVHFSYLGIPLFYYHRSRIYYSIIQKVKIETILTHGNYELAYTPKLSVDLRNRLDYPCIEGERAKTGSSKLGNIFRFFILSTKRRIKGWFSKNAVKKKEHLYFTSHKLLTNQGNAIKHPFLGSLVEKDDPRFGIIDILPATKFSGEKLVYDEQKLNHRFPIKTVFGDAIAPPFGLINISSIRKAYAYKKALNKQKHSFRATCSRLENQILQEFFSLMSTSRLYIYQFLMYDRFFKGSAVKTISTVTEQSPLFRPMLDAARKNGIRTIGIQHGSLNTNNLDYMFAIAESKNNPVPDYTIVWGNRYKEVLTKHSCYTEAQIQVLGQLRTDSILNQTREVPKQIQEDRTNGKTVVLFASQPQPNENLRYRSAKDICELAKDFQELAVYIKLHPIEDKPYYEKIVQETGANVTLWKNEVDLYDALSAADIISTCYSTVGTEAIYFGKPLFVLDYLNIDQSRFIADGIGFGVSNYNELHTKMKSYLKGSLAIPRDAMQRYIEESVYRIDGQTANRYIDFIVNIK